MTKFVGPAYECFYVPNGKTACFNSLGELETDDKEVIEHLSRLSDEGLYGISIVKGKKDVSEQKTSLEVNKSDEIIIETPVEEVTETPVITEEVVVEQPKEEVIVDETSKEVITEEVTETATFTDGVKKRKAK